MATTPETIDDYINGLPLDARPVVERICQIVRKSAPMAEEKISFGAPGSGQSLNLVHRGQVFTFGAELRR